MKHILLLTDFSKSATNAMEYALAFFNTEKCHFHLMYVHKSNSFTMDDLMSSSKKNVYDAILKDEKQQLEAYKTQLQNTYNQHQFSTIIDYDNLLSAIKQTIDSQLIDLIIAGYDGATSLFEVVFGTNTLQIIRNIACPTLIIPEDFSFNDFKDVLLPLDEHDMLDTKEFDRLLKFLDINKTHFHVLRMEQDNHLIETDKQQLNTKVKSYDYHSIKNVALADAVSTYQQLKKIDIIGLIVEKESFLKRLIAESSTTKISKSLSLPLLIVHH
ncbi:universal stress protein [Mangrovimonas cancribranchiae]|uniref:Universal stress protein n=1 Tax=Mangrovimonas cancribranchiae TaxID=3080055 RepID=A0AAU6NYV8_9FLAO